MTTTHRLFRSFGARKHTHWRRSMRQESLYLIVLAALVVFVGPFLWLVDIALKQGGELLAFPVQWLPTVPQWQNFQQAVTMIDFWHYAQNSFFLAFISATLTTVTSACVGFGFARMRSRFKNVFFIVMISTLMLPQIITLIPIYILFSKLGMVDTYWPWVLWGLGGSPYLSFLFRQYFSGIPGELEDAAILDGANYFRIFWQIFLPLARPILATSFILTFAYVWGDYTAPSLLLSQDNTTLSAAIAAGYVDPHDNILANVQAAGAVLYVLPVVVIFLFAQRTFIRSIATTGVKG